MTELLPGAKYRVRYRNENQRYDRVCVMVYLGVHAKSFVFNPRPVAGTMYLPMRWVREVTRVPDNTPVMVNERAD